MVGVGKDRRVYNKVWAGGGWWPGQLEWASIGPEVYRIDGRLSIAWSGTERFDVVAKATKTSAPGQRFLIHKYWTPTTHWMPN